MHREGLAAVVALVGWVVAFTWIQLSTVPRVGCLALSSAARIWTLRPALGNGRLFVRSCWLHLGGGR